MFNASWSKGRGQAIDVAVTCPFTINNMSREEPCEHYAESKKHAYYDADFKGTNFLFAAMVFESTGAMNEEGKGVLRQLFRFAAKRQGIPLSVYCGRAWAQFAIFCSQAILNRVGGVGVFDDLAEDASEH